MYSFQVHDVRPIADKMPTVAAETFWANKFTTERYDRASKQVVRRKRKKMKRKMIRVSMATCPNILRGLT